MNIIARRIVRLLIGVLVGIVAVNLLSIGWIKRGYRMISDSELEALAGRLRSHVIVLSHDIGDCSVYQYKSLQKASQYIQEQFLSFGYSPTLQKYTVEGKEVENIIVEKRGTTKPDEIIIVGAHYDTCFNPGADDNASAVAGMLELARLTADKQGNRTVRFIAFVNEEPPFFKTEQMGSFVYTKASQTKGEKTKAALVLEMIGYYTNKLYSQRYPPFLGIGRPNRGNFIAVVGNFASAVLVRRVSASFKAHSNFPLQSAIAPAWVPGIDFSDHWSFWKFGCPAVMITDTAFQRNPNYHTQTDTYDTLDYESMAQVISGLDTVLVDLAR